MYTHLLVQELRVMLALLALLELCLKQLLQYLSYCVGVCMYAHKNLHINVAIVSTASSKETIYTSNSAFRTLPSPNLLLLLL
jgi:hypothetical protein